jgi:hypothetical protein
VFNVIDAKGDTRAYCFEHDPLAGPPVNINPVPPDAPMFHVDVTAGFASMLLEHTIMANQDQPDAASKAFTSLALNTQLDEDICAGFLLATTAMCAIGGIADEALAELAERYESQAEWEDQPAPPLASVVGPVLVGLGSGESSGDDSGDDESVAVPDNPDWANGDGTPNLEAIAAEWDDADAVYDDLDEPEVLDNPTDEKEQIEHGD